MPLASMPGILFHCELFWAGSTLEMLRNLISTSKGFNSELVIVKKGQSLVEFAIESMMKNNPNFMNKWVLKFSYAKYCFSLQMDMMLHHCVLLPAGDRCHLGIRYWIYKRKTYPNLLIHFIDAYRLTLKRPGGIKAAMDRRHILEVKVKASAAAHVEKVGNSYRLIEANSNKAAERLKMTLRNNDGAFTETELRKGIRLLEQLGFDAGLSSLRMASSSVERPWIKEIRPDAREELRSQIQLFKTIVTRYNNHSKFCPLVMTPLLE
jgi:hypothetical protein